jgi:hypothetical protein
MKGKQGLKALDKVLSYLVHWKQRWEQKLKLKHRRKRGKLRKGATIADLKYKFGSNFPAGFTGLIAENCPLFLELF